MLLSQSDQVLQVEKSPTYVKHYGTSGQLVTEHLNAFISIRVVIINQVSFILKSV